MQSKVLSALRRYEMVKPGDTVICALSGGADSMALLWCLWLEKERLDISVEAAHFNHHLRGEESDRDEKFVRDFCGFHDIPLHVGAAEVKPGKKGLEAAAREARYGFLRSLKGILATAHTADDNAETVLLHLIRGTGLRGLGGITPKSEGLIRPMLDVTRAEVEEFLAENYISHIEDSSNAGDAFLRNRIRHQVMPLLVSENPSLAENLSAMAQRLRFDEEALTKASRIEYPPSVKRLREMEPALRRRALERYLRHIGVKEPEAKHIQQAENLVLCANPSAHARYPGGIVLRRSYDSLLADRGTVELETRSLVPGQTLELPEAGLRISCTEGEGEGIRIHTDGKFFVRSRRPGDEITLSGGTKSLKKLFIDRKIPQHLRGRVPVIADEAGVLAVYGIGENLSRREGKLLTVQIEKISAEAE